MLCVSEFEFFLGSPLRRGSHNAKNKTISLGNAPLVCIMNQQSNVAICWKTVVGSQSSQACMLEGGPSGAETVVLLVEKKQMLSTKLPQEEKGDESIIH